jgi:hypothetical protein
MSEKKNIDRLFQEGFKEFEVQPPAMVWDAIEKELDQKKKLRRIPLWWTIGGIAAGLAILFTSIYLGIGNDITNKQQPFVNSEKGTDTELNPQDSLQIKDNSTNIEATPYDNKINKERQLVTAPSKVNTESLNNLSENSKGNTRTNAPLKTSHLVTSRDASSEAHRMTNEKTKKPYTNSSGSNIKLTTSIAQNNTLIPATKEEKRVVLEVGSTANLSTRDGIAIEKSPLKEGLTNKNVVNGLDIRIRDELIDKAIAEVDSIKKKLPSLEDIAAQEQQSDSIMDTAFKGRWAATTQVGPVYSNSLSGSAVNNEVRDNNRDAGLNLSYGLGVSYELSPRWSVRTGINQVHMAYSTQDINYQIDVSTASRGQSLPQRYSASAVRNDTPIGNSPVSNAAQGTDFAAQELVSNQFQGIKGEISQQLGYIEVPLELKYSLVNSKFKINLVGGMSALFLTDNAVAIQNSSQRLELGEDRNFNDFNQSANFGLGFGYDFTNQLGAFIEPSFKYQLSTLRNNVADFRPYIIGIQSGVTYRF